jgi:hypothetical protein
MEWTESRVRSRKSTFAIYETSFNLCFYARVYPIGPTLWRWEVRAKHHNGVVGVGTARTSQEAKVAVLAPFMAVRA